MLSKYPKLTFVSFLLLACLAWIQVGIESSLISPYGDICNHNEYKNQIECSAHNIYFVIAWHIIKFFNVGVITAIATAFIAVFTWRLWWSTEKLWEESKASSAIAKQASNIATGAERARIWMHDIILSDISDGAAITYPSKITRFQISFKIENWGRSPGFNARCIINLTVVGDEHLSDIAKDDFVVPATLDNLKGQRIDIVIHNPIPANCIEPNGKEISIPTDTWDSIKSFDKYLFLHGGVTYDDIFGKPHESSFGYRYIYPPSGTTGQPWLAPLNHADYWQYT